MAQMRSPQALTKRTAFEATRRIPFMTLALSSKKAKPYACTMLFHVDKDWNVYFTTHESTFKHKLMMENPEVSMVAYELGDVYFQMSGRVKVMKDAKLIDRVFTELATKAAMVEGFWPPILNVRGNDYVVYCMKTSWVRAMGLFNLPIRANQPPYLQIR